MPCAPTREDAVKHKYYLGCFVPADSPFPGRDTVAQAEQTLTLRIRSGSTALG